MDGSLDTAFSPAPSVGDELAPGTSLCQGQYTIVRYLNSGGFGVTYLAHDSLGRKVVLKECFPGAMCCRTSGTVRIRSRSHDMDFERVVELFEREALALAQLQHPNIVGVHQIFQDNGTAYMAMDFVEGPDLFDLLETRPDLLEPPTVRRILDQLLAALAYVHNADILHRDISPDNILLAPGQVPVLIDFGAAREDAKRATRMLSRIHTVKDGYSPQEFYLAGSKQEQSSDLYALAATIHHLIIGNPPPNSNVRLAAVAQNEPDPYVQLSGRVSGYDPAFLKAIDICLSLFAKDRLRCAEDWIDMISGRPAVAAAPAEPVFEADITEEVMERISQLVSETSSFLENSDASTPKSAAAPAPAVIEAQDSKARERAYWAILNEDPAEIRAEVERAQTRQLQDAAKGASRIVPRKPVLTRPVTARPKPRDVQSEGIGGWFSKFLPGRRTTDAGRPCRQ